MPNYEELSRRKNQLIRKALDGGLWIGTMAIDPITALTTTGGDLATFADPDNDASKGYADGGWLTDDGMQFTHDSDTSDVTSFGSVEPTRSDVQSDTTSVQAVFQEQNRLTIALMTGVDIDQLVPDPETGELQATKENKPVSKYFRLLALSVDDTEYGETYSAVSMPRSKISERGDGPNFSKGDDPLQVDVTFQAFKDTAAGYSVRYMFGGPGWIGLLTDLGFEALAPAGG